MTSSKTHRPKRRAVIIPAGYVPLAVAADKLSISLSTLRRTIRPKGDAAACALWARRLDIRKRDRPGNLIPVFYLAIERLETWAHELNGLGLPLVDPALADNVELADGEDDDV